MKPVSLPPSALHHLDMMRGLAAFAVVVFHVRGLMFKDYEELSQRGLLVKLVYLATGFGHEAVVIFFVLSGLFIGHSVLSSSASGTWSWKRFLLNRFTRLYLVLLPGLVLTLAWDTLGMHLLGANGNIYAAMANAPHGSFQDARQTIGPGTFLGNLFFLQTIFCSPYGSNSPLWSLSLEFWVYILFPLLVRALARSNSGSLQFGRRLALLGLAAAMLAIGGLNFAFYAGIWLMGAIVAYAWSSFRIRRGFFLVVLGGLFFFGTLMIARLGLTHNIRIEDALLGAGTAVFVLSLLSSEVSNSSKARIPTRLTYARVATALAGCSYTLYLVHFPPLALLHAWRFQHARWAPSISHLAIGATVAVALLCLYAYPLARLTEARTKRVRHWLERRLRLAMPSAPNTEGA